ncbi:hypothetical protein [Fibrella arboris]|uniref:hypothetical protein n=1 Tax=Fibrella arboris TaxID=3242486 RepID=UPI00352271AC
MEEANEPRKHQVIDVPAHTFNTRLGELAQTQPGSVYSRLALIHQVAKALATESVNASGHTPTDLTIDELTDPPLYEGMADVEPVLIQFSFSE